MKTLHLILGGTAAALILSTSTAQATLLAYDSFNYPVGTLVGANGGTGFSGAYTASGAGSSVSSPGFTYTDSNSLSLAVGGNKANYADGNNGVFRNLTNSPEALGSTLYISFLMQIPSGAGGYAGLSLHESGGENLFLGKPSSNPNFGIDSKANGVFSSTQAVTLQSFLVFRIDFNTTTTISMYVNPTLGTEPAAASVTATRSAFAYNQLRIQSGGGATGAIDEVRFATTYAEVAPAVPEPSALGLAALGGLGLIRRRRRA